MVFSFTADTLTHPIQDGTSGGASNWQFEVVNGVGSWTMRWNLSGNGINSPFRYEVAGLSKNATYRIEAQLHRISDTTFNWHSWIYNSAGTQIAGDADFDALSSSLTLADNPALTFNSLTNLRGLQCGLNGISGGVEADFPLDLYYQGGLAVAVERCGAYGNLVGES